VNGSADLGKRALDLGVALAAMAVLWPLFLVIAILIKLDSRGPVFFRQERAGRRGTTFRIFKFRTMIVGAYRSGARLTVKRDPRITQVGQVLRWTKLDELPQILNVVAGDMSLVGPRPEDPYFVNFYSRDHRDVLSVKPGLIGPSQIDGRDEVEKYPEGCEDTEKYYIEHIMPEKLDRDLAYVRSATLWGDVGFLVGGFWKVVASQFKKSFFARVRGRLALLSMDLGLIVLSYVLANFIHFDWDLPNKAWPYISRTLFWSVLLKPPVFIYYGLYQRSMRWVGRRDLAAIVKAVSLSSALVVAVTYFTGLQAHSRAIFIDDATLLLFLMTGCRFALRHLLSGASRQADRSSYVRVLVAGSGHGGESILRSLLEDPKSRYLPVGIIDHEPHRWGALIHGIRVMGGANDIAMAASTHGVEMVLLSMADLDPSVVRDIVEACKRHEIQYRLIPALSDVLSQQEPELVRTAILPHEGRL
jgi:lipopolysaccharide/colanic/teichoic acid biosynthesis glycosyltransferase